MKRENRRLIKFEALPRSIRWQARRAGRLDGKAELPSGEPNPATPQPGADAVALRWDSAIAVLDQQYREQLRGLLPILRRQIPQPTTGNEEYGPSARAVRASRETAERAQSSRDAAADEVLLITEKARAAVLEVDAVRRQALAVYANALLRRHPNGKDLSARGWRPGVTPLPKWVGVPGPELLHALHALGYTALDQ